MFVVEAVYLMFRRCHRVFVRRHFLIQVLLQGLVERYAQLVVNSFLLGLIVGSIWSFWLLSLWQIIIIPTQVAKILADLTKALLLIPRK